MPALIQGLSQPSCLVFFSCLELALVMPHSRTSDPQQRNPRFQVSSRLLFVAYDSMSSRASLISAPWTADHNQLFKFACIQLNAPQYGYLARSSGFISSLPSPHWEVAIIRSSRGIQRSTSSAGRPFLCGRNLELGSYFEFPFLGRSGQARTYVE